MSEGKAVVFESPAACVRAFFEAAEECLAFLSGEPRFTCERALCLGTARGLGATTEDALKSLFFLARVIFSTDRLSGEITYGNRQFCIQCMLGPIPRLAPAAEHYGLWEWVQAFGDTDARAGGAQFVMTPTRVQEVVAEIGEILHAYAPRVANEGSAPELVDRLEASRELLTAEWREKEREKEREREHRRAAARAAEAFRDEDFALVIELLAPWDEHLSPAERKKLEYARKHAQP